MRLLIDCIAALRGARENWRRLLAEWRERRAVDRGECVFEFEARLKQVLWRQP